MTDYLRCGDFVGHTDEESQFMGFCPMSENACDGYGMNGGAMSPMELPCSPASEGSDWSMSSTTTECMSQPTSPVPEDLKKPFKSSLKRHGESGKRPKMSVRWTVDTVFETRPLVKRRRPSPSYNDEIESDEQDSELKAPIPTKKAKIAELETHAAAATALHFLPPLSAAAPAPAAAPYSFTPIFPEASRTVIPTFNFSSFVARSANTMTTLASTSNSSTPSEKPATSKPHFEPFKFAAPKSFSHSNLLVAAINKI